MSEYQDSMTEDGGGTARGLQRLVAVIFAGVGVYVATTALSLPYYTPVGPGPAFFPFWLGLALSVFSLAVLVLSFLRPETDLLDQQVLPPLKPALQMLAIFAMIAFFALTVRPLGFVVSIFFVLLVLQLVNGGRLSVSLAVAAIAAFGVGYAFSNWLGVFVPPAPYGLLAGLGL